MSWTNPPTFVAGDALTAAQLNTYLRDNENYLKGIADGAAFSGVQVDITSSQSIANDTDTLISFNRDPIDVSSWWSTGTDVTVPSSAIPAGYTNVVCHWIATARFASNGAGNRKVTVLQNGAAVDALSLTAINGETTYVFIAGYVSAAAADVFTMQVWQNSGGSLNCEVAHLTVVRFAPLS